MGRGRLSYCKLTGKFFFVKKARHGRYRACVDLYPGTKGVYRYCRDAETREKGNLLLRCLRRELVHKAGPVVSVIEAWWRRELCNGTPLEGLKKCHG